jgi:hypothetical protein
MAANEDQPQAVILDVLIRPRYVGAGDFLQAIGDLNLPFVKPPSTPQGINRLEPSRGYQPSPRVRGHTLRFPSFHRRREGFVHGLFSQVEVTKNTHQGREDTPRLRAINFVNDGPNVFPP